MSRRTRTWSLYSGTVRESSKTYHSWTTSLILLGRCVISRGTWMRHSSISLQAHVPASFTTLPMPPFAPDYWTWNGNSAKLSKSNAALKKNRPAVNCCVQYNARFEKPCWPCLRRNTTGSIFRYGLRGQCQVCRMGHPFQYLRMEVRAPFWARLNRSHTKISNGSFSNSQGHCSALPS